MQTSSAEVYLIDGQCVNTRVAHSSVSSPSSSSLLAHALPARPRAYSLSPLAPRQPLPHSLPTSYSTFGGQSAGGSRRRAATLDGSELMHHVSAALNHITEESPMGVVLRGGARPSDTACATVACTSRESSSVAGTPIGPVDHRRRVIETLSQNVQTLLCDSLGSDVSVQGVGAQVCPADTIPAHSWLGSEQGGAHKAGSQVSTTDWGNMRESQPIASTPTILANLPSHCVAVGVRPVSDVGSDGEEAACTMDLARPLLEEVTQVDRLSVNDVLGLHRRCLNLHNTDAHCSHVLELGQTTMSSSEGEEDEMVSCQEEGRGGMASQEEERGGVASQEEGRGGVASQEEERGGVASREEERGGVASQEEGRGGVASQEEERGGVASQEEGRGVASQEEERGRVASRQEEQGGVASHEEGRVGVASQEEGRGGVASREDRRGGVASQEEGRGDVVAQGEPSIYTQLLLKDSDGASMPPCTGSGCEPSFPLSPPLPPIGAEWQQPQAQTSTPGRQAGPLL